MFSSTFSSRLTNTLTLVPAAVQGDGPAMWSRFGFSLFAAPTCGSNHQPSGGTPQKAEPQPPNRQLVYLSVFEGVMWHILVKTSLFVLYFWFRKELRSHHGRKVLEVPSEKKWNFEHLYFPDDWLLPSDWWGLFDSIKAPWVVIVFVS